MAEQDRPVAFILPGKVDLALVRFIATISKLISISMVQTDAASELEHANADLVRERNALLTPGYEPLTGLVGSSPAWIRAIEAIRMVAGTELPVLVLGETPEPVLPGRDASSWLMEAFSSWTKQGICRWSSSQSCCGSYRRVHSSGWVASGPSV